MHVDFLIEYIGLLNYVHYRMQSTYSYLKTYFNFFLNMSLYDVCSLILIEAHTDKI